MSFGIEQRRIQTAYKIVDEVVASGNLFDAWRTAILGFGAEVQRCGLLQALAFLQRDSGDPKVYTTLEKGLRQHLYERGHADQQGDLFKQLRTMEGDRYMLVSREVLLLSLWLKRATQAEKAKKDEGEKENPRKDPSKTKGGRS